MRRSRRARLGRRSPRPSAAAALRRAALRWVARLCLRARASPCALLWRGRPRGSLRGFALRLAGLVARAWRDALPPAGPPSPPPGPAFAPAGARFRLLFAGGRAAPVGRPARRPCPGSRPSAPRARATAGPAAAPRRLLPPSLVGAVLAAAPLPVCRRPGLRRLRWGNALRPLRFRCASLRPCPSRAVPALGGLRPALLAAPCARSCARAPVGWSDPQRGIIKASRRQGFAPPPPAPLTPGGFYD